MIVDYIDRSDDSVRDDFENENVESIEYEKILIYFLTDDLSRVKWKQLHIRNEHCVENKNIDNRRKIKSFIIQ